MLMFSNLIKKGSRLVTSEQKTILTASVVIGFLYALSAVFGFIRNRLLSGYFGDSSDLGVFFAADAIPSLIFSLIVAGSLSAAFIPIFSKLHKKSKEAGWELASGVLNVSLVLLLFLGVGVLLGSDFLVREVLARNTSLTNDELTLMSQLMKIMMLAQIALIVSSIFTSILQSFNRFIIPALAPLLYNFGIIVFLVLFFDRWGIFAPAYGMIFGSLLHLAIQIPIALNLGFKYKKTASFKTEGVAQVYKLMIPRTLGQAAHKLLLPIYTNLALFISAPSAVIMTFAFAIQNLPIRVIGMSTGQASLPILSNAANEEDLSDYRRLVVETIHQIIFFVMFISILFFVLRVPLVRLAVGAKRYSWEATIMTSYTLGFLCFSMVAQTLVLVLARGFYALHNTITPVLIGVFSVIVNALIAIILIRYYNFGIWSVGLAYTIGSIIDCFLLFVFLYKRVKGFVLSEILDEINRILLASLITGIFLYVPLKIMDELVFDTTRTLGLIFLTGTVSVIGLVSYLVFSKLFNVKQMKIVYYIVGRINLYIKRKNIVVTG